MLKRFLLALGIVIIPIAAVADGQIELLDMDCKDLILNYVECRGEVMNVGKTGARNVKIEIYPYIEKEDRLGSPAIDTINYLPAGERISFKVKWVFISQGDIEFLLKNATPKTKEILKGNNNLLYQDASHAVTRKSMRHKITSDRDSVK